MGGRHVFQDGRSAAIFFFPFCFTQHVRCSFIGSVCSTFRARAYCFRYLVTVLLEVDSKGRFHVFIDFDEVTGSRVWDGGGWQI